MRERKHTTIMNTYIVRYTALMGSDEDRAFQKLAKNRKIHTKLVEQFNGTLIKEMGDGMVINFNLASDAVRCTIEIQKAAKSQDIPLMIGIHERWFLKARECSKPCRTFEGHWSKLIFNLA